MPPSSAPPREPHLFRFGLRQLLFFFTLAGVFCALMVKTDGPWPLVIGVTTLLIGAHLFAALVGNRLRDTSQDVIKWKAASSGVDDDAPRAESEPSEAAKASLPPTTPLADHGRVSHWLLWILIGGAIAGMILGGAILALTIGERIGWAGWLVGTVSCSVLGGWVAFLASSFGSIAKHAWRHASEKGD